MAAGIVVARTLGPEQRGYFSLVVMGATLISSLGHMGLGTAITYFTGGKNFRNQDIFAFITTTSLTIGTLLAVVIFFAAPHIPRLWVEIPPDIMLIGLIAAPFILYHDFTMRFLLALLRVRQSNLTNLFKFLSYFILVIVLLWKMDGGLKEAVIAFSASVLIAVALAFVFFTRDLRKGWRLDRSMPAEFFKYGSRAYFLLTFNFINLRLSIFLIKAILGAADVGYYSIAITLAERLWYIPNALGAILFPTLMRMKADRSDFSAKVIRNNFVIMVPLAIAVVLLSKPVISIMYGEEYLPAASVLYSIIWGITVFPVFKLLSVEFASRNRLAVSVVTSFIGIVVNLTLSIILTSRIGIVGAGIAVSVSYTVMSTILAVIFLKETKMPVRELFVPTREEFARYGEIARRHTRRILKRDNGNTGD